MAAAAAGRMRVRRGPFLTSQNLRSSGPRHSSEFKDVAVVPLTPSPPLPSLSFVPRCLLVPVPTTFPRFCLRDERSIRLLPPTRLLRSKRKEGQKKKRAAQTMNKHGQHDPAFAMRFSIGKRLTDKECDETHLYTSENKGHTFTWHLVNEMRASSHGAQFTERLAKTDGSER